MTEEVRTNARPNGAALATTVGLLAAALYLVCVIAVLLWPQGFLAFISLFAHGVDLTPIWNPQVGLGRAIIGLAATYVLAYAITAAGVSLYGRLSGRA